MTNLFLDRILEFYGVPQILVAKDSFGTQYLCLLFDDGAGCRYTGIKIPSSGQCLGIYFYRRKEPLSYRSQTVISHENIPFPEAFPPARPFPQKTVAHNDYHYKTH